ncbi:MAG: chemotaxis protein CheW, partial [Firmicutes bacterium]|nr:chemotaxis protein CheW [Bacillota bacterium]
MEENPEIFSGHTGSWGEYLEVMPFLLGGTWFAVQASESELMELSSLDESEAGDFILGFSGSGDSLTPLVDISKLLRFQNSEKPSCADLSKVIKVKKGFEAAYLIFDEAGQNIYVPSWKLQPILALSEEARIIAGVFSEGEKEYFIVDGEEFLKIVKYLVKEKKEEDAAKFMETFSELLESMRVNAMIYGVPLEDLFETKGEEYIVFSIRDEWFSMNLRDIKEVLLKPQITSVPGVNPFVRGVMNWHGSIVSVLELSSF